MVSKWSKWTTCQSIANENCGPGLKYRYREVLVEPVNGGFSCPKIKKMKKCTVSCSGIGNFKTETILFTFNLINVCFIDIYRWRFDAVLGSIISLLLQTVRGHNFEFYFIPFRLFLNNFAIDVNRFDDGLNDFFLKTLKYSFYLFELILLNFEKIKVCLPQN